MDGLVTFLLIFLGFLTLSFGEECNQNGLCLGHLIEVQESVHNENEFNAITDCVYRCREVFGCKFASFNSKHKTCTLSRACSKVVLTKSNYKHSNVNCNHKILVVGGYGDPNPDPSINILSLKDNKTCQISNVTIGNPIASTIGLMNGLPTICGGFDAGSGTTIDSCYVYNVSKNEFVQSAWKLRIGVRSAGYARWRHSFVISGGTANGNQVVNLVQIPGEAQTWNMPVNIAQHCMKPINDSSYILIGGYQNGTLEKKTFIFSPKDKSFDWEEGPNLATARVDHMCGTMTKEGKRLILVVGGSSNGSSNGDQTDCEYMELPTIDGKKTWPWKKCTDLPIPLSGAELIEDLETGDVLLLGGHTKLSTQNTIYRLSDITGEWILQKQTLKAAREYFSALVVPPDIFDCDESSSKITYRDEL